VLSENVNMSKVLDGAKQGFTAAELYDRARPSYVPEVINHIVHELKLTKDSVIIDLAAGTGKMTELLLKHPTLAGAKIIAVEPVPEMRQKLTEKLGSSSHLQVLEGTAGKIPLPPASVDVVVVAQAFHWFDNMEALVEISRVLKPGKALCLVWNSEDGRTTQWVAKLRESFEQFDGDVPQYRTGKWKNCFEEDSKNQNNSLYLPFTSKYFEWNLDSQTPSMVWDRIQSKSFIVRLDAATRDKFKQDVMKILHTTNPSFSSLESPSALVQSTVTTKYPYRTELVIANKRN